MSRWDFRTDRISRRSLRSLIRRAGRAPVIEANQQTFEHLEGRVLLAGDEPGFNQVFNVPNPFFPPQIPIDGVSGVGTGEVGAGSSIINPAGEDDVFRFTAPSNDFVRIWADTRSTGSTLDSRIEIYTGIIGGSATLVASGSNNGTLTAGVFNDGWVGFKAVAGTEYFVVVRADPLTGTGSTGDYTLRINAISTDFPALNGTTGAGQVNGSITRAGSDVVYRITTPAGTTFNGLMTILAQTTPADLDPRIELFDVDGNLIKLDSDAGSLTDAFLGAVSQANSVYYLRVRSDEFGDPLVRPSTGNYTIKIDAVPTTIALDPVTRLSATLAGTLASQKDIQFFGFTAQGTGLTFISLGTLGPAAPPFLADSALRLFNDQGVQIGFNELPGALSRLVIQLEGGKRYFLVVDAFDAPAFAARNYSLNIESHHTFVPGNTDPVDDHINTPAGTTAPDRRLFEIATPIVWGPPVAAPIPVPGLLPVPLPSPAADHVRVLLGVGQGRIHAAGDSDLFQFVPPVDMLGEFEGRVNPNTIPPPDSRQPLWNNLFRPATRLQVIAQGADNFVGNPAIRIFDSNLNVIYTNNAQVITNSGRFGALDPASVPPLMPVPFYQNTFGANQPADIEVWGGEVYYLEITASGTGRYNFTIQVDAPTDTISDFRPTLPVAGNFANAWEVRLDPNTGEGRNYNNTAGGQLIPLPGGQYTVATGNGTPIMNGRGFAMNMPLPVPPAAGTGATVANLLGTPGTRGQLLFRMSDFGVIIAPTTTHLYQFRALYTGTAEVRINTTAIADEFWEAGVRSYDTAAPYDPIVAPNQPVQEIFGPKTKTLNSPLDSALRIFDNDQTQLAYNNDNGVTAGESDTIDVGAFAGKTFWRRDARAVFPVVAGNTYYVQVESGQAASAALGNLAVDWRRATGGYELLVNSMPNLNFDDDHVNAGGAVQATPIPADLSVSNTTDVIGSVIGEINNTLANPNDTDTFVFVSPGDGTLKFTLSTRGTPPDSFSRVLSIFDTNGALVSTAAGINTDEITLSVSALQGDRFFAVVDGDEGNPPFEGRYTISVSGVPFIDDHASEHNYGTPTHIDKDLYDYDGTEDVPGSIETTGDSDIFTFDSLDFDLATITVTGSPGFSPAIRIYEISIDPAGNPIRLHIGNNRPALGGQVATVTFSVSAPPRITGGQSYPRYYVVVSGADPDQDTGTYVLNLSVTKTTDDHADGPDPAPPSTPTSPGQFTVATPIVLDGSGVGTDTGIIEVLGDSDLFTFVAPAQGQIVVTLTSGPTSLLLPRVRIIDGSFNAVADITTSQFFVTGPDQLTSVATFTFTGVRNATYYIMVEGATSVGNVFKPNAIGAYSFDVTVPVPDDHANVGEFNLATNIPLSSFSGDGSATGIISPALDTDLFTFTALVGGTMVVTVSTPGSLITPVLRLFDSNQSELGTAVVDGGVGDEDGVVNGSVTRSMSILAASSYWVLVNSDAGGAQTSGFFVVSLDGPAPAPGPDDHADAGDYANATQILINQTTGDGTATGLIEAFGDSDLFYFISMAGSISRPLPAFIQVVTPNGQLMDLGLRIIRQDQIFVVATDTEGGPGYNAGVQFGIVAAAERYYVEVTGLDNLTGSYTVRIDTSPETYFLYFPGSVANPAIREYFSIGNANAFDVNYTITLRYLNASLPDVVLTGTVQPGKRGGITVSDGDPQTPDLATANERYAIIIESDGFLAANLSHYEADASGGEAFTRFSSTTWSFAKGEKLPGGVNDFVEYYNPNPGATRVTITAYQPNGTSFTTFQIVQPFKAGRFDFINTAALPVGQFAFTITSEPVNPSDPHVGIVAGLTHYDVGNDTGYFVMGSTGGATAGVVPGLIDSGNLTPSQASSITIFNSSNTAATINLVGKYLNSNIPDLIRPISLNPFESITLTGTQLGLVANQTVGLRYDSNTPITVLTSTTRFGDADASQAQTDVGNRWYFGDAFINRLRAGQLYFESMYFYNPAPTPTSIQLRFVFNVGNETSYTFNVPANNFARVELHTLAAILNHAVFNYFSIEASSDSAFAVTMSHYDLVLGGGWLTAGAPLGLTNTISSLS